LIYGEGVINVMEALAIAFGGFHSGEHRVEEYKEDEREGRDSHP